MHGCDFYAVLLLYTHLVASVSDLKIWRVSSPGNVMKLTQVVHLSGVTENFGMLVGVYEGLRSIVIFFV